MEAKRIELFTRTLQKSVAALVHAPPSSSSILPQKQAARGELIRFKVCKVVYPGDTHTYDSRYLTEEEYLALRESTDFVLEFLTRKKKRPELVRQLQAAAAKLKELL